MIKHNTANILIVLLLTACIQTHISAMKDQTQNNPYYSNTSKDTLNVSNDIWKKILSTKVYDIARGKGTEMPYSSPLEKNFDTGTYYCGVCGNPLFKSDTKFNSQCGWPAFFQTIEKNSLIYKPDNSYNMERVEVLCGRCHSHLGHVFDDPNTPTGLWYCINGVVLDFKKAATLQKQYKDSLDSK
ncbi:MAG: peptide-methionine (R)-S-oxide reductase MsrB [Phycisphaerales bacterium]|nr:peptide-methionine (R)-S-oxide reductase MsrB [Phycisphaerales bacterium]